MDAPGNGPWQRGEDILFKPQGKKYYLQPYVAHTHHTYTQVPGGGNCKCGGQGVRGTGNVILEEKSRKAGRLMLCRLSFCQENGKGRAVANAAFLQYVSNPLEYGEIYCMNLLFCDSPF